MNKNRITITVSWVLRYCWEMFVIYWFIYSKHPGEVIIAQQWFNLFFLSWYNPRNMHTVWLCYCWVMVEFTLILQDYFTGTGAILWLPQCQWSNPEQYGKIHLIYQPCTANTTTRKQNMTKPHTYTKGYTSRALLTCPKHPSDISVSLIETFVHNGVNEGWPVEEQTFVFVPVVLLRHLFPPVAVALPETFVADFLDLRNTPQNTVKMS